jgi:pyruvate dehydrogenase E2 component (dihydrolipoamide acetyltransferase)
MATKVYMEALSPTMEEGRLVSWLKDEGDEITEGDVLAEVETDKATMELVARGAGVLRKRMLGEGHTADVGTVIGVIATADEDIAEFVSEAGGDGGATNAAEKEDTEEREKQGKAEKQQSAGSEAETEEKDDEEIEEAAAAVAATGPSQQGGEGPQRVAAPPDAGSPASGEAPRRMTEAAPSAGDGDGRVKASPLARRLATESGLELGELAGSGPGGRVVKRDIEGAMQRPAAAEASEGATTEHRDLPLSQMRKTIAKRLTQSLGPVPHFFLTVEADMEEMVALRARLNERFADEGIKVSPNDLIIKATAVALQRHPMVNASWTGDAIRQFGGVHIGVAVAVEEGLITPVIRDADRKGIAEIAREIRELAGRAREKKLKPEEYTGSTFSISNLGMYGIEEFTAVINPPEAAILAVGAIEDRVVAVDRQATVRSRMRMTLSCDHRVVDGATGADFLRTLKGYLEDPLLMLA